jgi:hypothetical protein
MNECMCICMYACMHVCMYTYVHAEGYTAAATTEKYDMYPPPPHMYMQRDILLLQLQKDMTCILSSSYVHAEGYTAAATTESGK